jgi:hypothetical protein
MTLYPTAAGANPLNTQLLTTGGTSLVLLRFGRKNLAHLEDQEFSRNFSLIHLRLRIICGITGIKQILLDLRFTFGAFTLACHGPLCAWMRV